jgi:hypothetical protein
VRAVRCVASLLVRPEAKGGNKGASKGEASDRVHCVDIGQGCGVHAKSNQTMEVEPAFVAPSAPAAESAVDVEMSAEPPAASDSSIAAAAAAAPASAAAAASAAAVAAAAAGSAQAEGPAEEGDAEGGMIEDEQPGSSGSEHEDGEDDYEAVRRRNIERNNEKLRELQLFGLSSMAPKGITPRRKRATAAPPVAPTRVSGRERKRSQAAVRAEESEKAHMEWLNEERESKNARRAARKNRGRSREICEDCEVKTPSFGLASDRKRRWCHPCAQHHRGAVLLKTRTLCEDCNLVDPSFGKEGERKRRWCHGCAVQHADAVCLKSSHGRSVGWSPAARANMKAAVYLPRGWSAHYPQRTAWNNGPSRSNESRGRQGRGPKQPMLPPPPVVQGYKPGGFSMHYPETVRAPVRPGSAPAGRDGRRSAGRAPRPPCEDCFSKDPSFGSREDRKRRWCQSCAENHPGAILLKKRTPCEDCLEKDPSFGLVIDRRRRWCYGCAIHHAGAVCLKSSGHNKNPLGRAVGPPLPGTLPGTTFPPGTLPPLPGKLPPSDGPPPSQGPEPQSQQQSEAARALPTKAQAEAVLQPPDKAPGLTGTEIDDDVCMVCNIDSHHDKLLLCDSCPGAYHTFCMVPALSAIPDGAWFCDTCKKSGVEECKPLTAADALEAARNWYDNKSFFGVTAGLRMQPIKAYRNSDVAWSISYTTNPPTEGSPYFVRAEFVRMRQDDNSFVWTPEIFDEEGASRHRDGHKLKSAAVAGGAAAAAANDEARKAPAQMKKRRVGERVMAMFHDAHTYFATIVAVHKAEKADDGKPPSYTYTIDWDDGDPSCRQRSEQQVFTPGEHPDKDEDDQYEQLNAKIEPAVAPVAPAAKIEPAVAPAALETAATTQPSSSAEVDSSQSRTGRVRKRKKTFDPEVENGKPQWAPKVSKS